MHEASSPTGGASRSEVVSSLMPSDQALVLLNQGHELLQEYAEELKSKGNDSQAMGAVASAHALLSFVTKVLEACRANESAPVAVAQAMPEISTQHGPWIESGIHLGETYCQRCHVRSIFSGQRKCDPHVVYREPGA